MRPLDPTEAGRFHISSFSGGGGCVEVGRLRDGSAVVRDSKDPERRVRVAFERGAWDSFLLDLKIAGR